MLILTSALSNVSFEVFKNFDALKTNTRDGKLALLMPKNTPSEIP